MELLQGINACGTTVLMVTHAHEMVRHFGGRIINIDQGEVVFDEVIEGAEAEYLEGIDAEYPAEFDETAVEYTTDPSVLTPETEAASEAPETTAETGGTDN